MSEEYTNILLKYLVHYTLPLLQVQENLLSLISP